MILKELETGIDGLVRIVPKIRQCIAHLINVANGEQIDKGVSIWKKQYHMKMVCGNPEYQWMQGIINFT